jgi:hypothetical protein
VESFEVPDRGSEDQLGDSTMLCILHFLALLVFFLAVLCFKRVVGMLFNLLFDDFLGMI